MTDELTDMKIICCFCGNDVDFDKAIFINVIIEKETEDAQTLYAHSVCFDRVLHKNIPRYFLNK